MKSSRPRTVLALLHFPWHTQVSGDASHSRRFSYPANISSFAERVLRAAKGESGIIEPTFVYLPGVEGGDAVAKETGCDYFSVPVQLGVSLRKFPSEPPHANDVFQPSGAEKATNPLGSANDYEKKLIDAAIKGLKGNIEKGIDFVKNPPPPKE
jgi:malate dehydrogenase